MFKLSDYIAKRLKEVYGVEHFFMVSGGGAMHLNDSLGRYISYTANHHEQACAIAAEGYSRISGKLGVVNVTTGPGGLNCLNGVMGQWTDSVPVLYISGQVKCATLMASYPELPLRQLGDQEVDIVSIVKPITKYAVCVTKPEEIKYHLDRAIYEAMNGRKGPVWLDIPIDVQSALIDEDNLVSFQSMEKLPSCDVRMLAKSAAQKFAQAKRPLIVAGHGLRLSGMAEVFSSFIEKTMVPVVTTFNGMDLLESDNKNFAGRIGTVGQRAGNFTIQNADCILFLGTRNNIRQISYNWKTFAKNAYKIVVDIDEAELNKPTLVPDFKVNCDLGEFLPEFIRLYKPLDDLSDWLGFCKELVTKYSFERTLEYQQKSDNINVYNFIRKLTEALSTDDVLVAANGSACVCLHQCGVVRGGQRIIWNSGDASMGYELPAAVGAAYAGKNVVCLAGDGSIMMNIQELQTIVHNHLPVKIFVINNSGYSSIRQTQKNFFNSHLTGASAESGVSMPDFCKVAESFGIKSIKIQNPELMDSQIKSVLNLDGTVLCEVITEKDYAFSPKLSAKKLDDGTIVSPSIEDMSPFLDRNEFESNLI